MEAQQQQQQQQQQHYQYQYPHYPQNETLTSTQSSYDPNSSHQIQSYDQSTQAYYAYHHHHLPSSSTTTLYNQQQPQDYSSYYYQDYAPTSYHQSDPNSIHPPGVNPISVDSQQILVQNPHNLYYPNGFVVPSQPTSHQGFFQAGGSQAGRSGRGRGTFGRHGRGRGGGRGKSQTARSSAPSATAGAQSVASSSEAQTAPGKPAPRMAWCELCRVDCTTLEVLEQHRNGKKHKRNLKVHEELQNLSKQLTIQTPNVPMSQPIPQSAPQVVDESHTYHPPNDNVAAESKAEATSGKDTTDKAEASGALASQESVRKDHLGGRGGLKRRMMRGGRGGKWVRAADGSRRPVEPMKPKQVVPIICELCNVKCESQVVYESHIAGKKHLANMKRFQGHKEAFGEGIQALYPTISNLPSTSIFPQANQTVPADAQALASMMLSQQNLQDPQAAQAALAQLLHQHGIHDTQTLITQLIPYLLAQFQQVPGSLPVPAVGFGIPNQNSLGLGALVSTGAVSQSYSAEIKSEQQQNVTGNGESQAIVGANDKPADVPPENGKSQQ